MNDEARIGVAFGSPGGHVADISNLLEEITKQRPQLCRLRDLDGPNETIQILLDGNRWLLVFQAAVVLYGSEIVKEAGKSTWLALSRKLSKKDEAESAVYGKLETKIIRGQRPDYPIVVGYPRNLKDGRRHIGIELQTGTAEEVLHAVAILSENYETIYRKLDEWEARYAEKSISYEENSDCSVKLTICGTGEICINATIYDVNNRSNKERIQYILVKLPD